MEYSSIRYFYINLNPSISSIR